MAAKPSNWTLRGIVCGSREADPKIHSAEEWCAWARGPKDERLEGSGLSAEDALTTLTLHLKELA